MLARVKTQSVHAVDKIRARVQQILNAANVTLDDVALATHDDPVVADFLQIARMVTFSDVARRKRDGSTYLRKNLLAMLSSVETHAEAIQDFAIQPGHVTVQTGDCRNMGTAGVIATALMPS